MKYVCPMHPEVVSDKPGKCPKCGGMKLVPENELNKKNIHQQSEITIDSYIPLFIIIGLILLTAFTVSFANQFSITRFIENFMIGFFLVFAGFKLIDLNGFAEGYATYDLLAIRWFQYGYIYPFIELSFGLAMILQIYEQQILLAEILIMTFSGIGVGLKLWKKEKFQCACLGTFLKVPLTKITLVEDFGMAFLALILLIIR